MLSQCHDVNHALETERRELFHSHTSEVSLDEIERDQEHTGAWWLRWAAPMLRSLL